MEAGITAASSSKSALLELFAVKVAQLFRGFRCLDPPHPLSSSRPASAPATAAVAAPVAPCTLEEVAAVLLGTGAAMQNLQRAANGNAAALRATEEQREGLKHKYVPLLLHTDRTSRHLSCALIEPYTYGFVLIQ